MLLFAIFLTFVGIPNLADTSPPNLSIISFKKLLDTCTKLEHSNSTDCQYFISTYRWHYDDVLLVFDKVLEKNRTAASPAKNILEKRLIHLIENSNFDLTSLGKHSFHRLIEQSHEPMAIAIWTHLKKYSNDSSEMQLQICSNNMAGIMKRKMVQLIKTMVTDSPDCLHRVQDLIRMAFDVDIFLFLFEHGVEITAHDIDYLLIWRSEIFFGAVRKYPYYFFLKCISEWFQSRAIKIWELLKSENYSNVLLEICNDTIIHAVSDNMFQLVKTMYNDFPECILSKGDILMDIAVRGGMDLDSRILFLNEHGVEITNGLAIRNPIALESGFRDMILFLNDIGMEVTAEHLQILSTYVNTNTFEWVRLHTQLSRETFINSPIKYEYLARVLRDRRIDLFKKIVDFNEFEIEWMKNLIYLIIDDVFECKRFISLLYGDSKIDITTQAN